MSYDFTANEVFEMAEQIERNGAAFYRRAAGDVTDPAAQKLLNQLAEMEDEHEKTFADLRTALTAPEKAGQTFDPLDESLAYLRALPDTKVFFEKSIDTTSMRDILKASIVAEKDSIVFYLGMKDLVPDASGKERLDDIIKEEMAHIRLLSRELMAL